MNESITMVIAGAVGTGLVGLLFWFVTQYFDGSGKEQKTLVKKVDALSISDAKTDTKLQAIAKVLDHQSMSLGKLMSKTSEISGMMNSNSKDVAKLEGRLDEHMSMISNYIQTIGHMSRQIDALFRYVDGANQRSTDERKTGGI